jgi:hypothetical protein
MPLTYEIECELYYGTNQLAQIKEKATCIKNNNLEIPSTYKIMFSPYSIMHFFFFCTLNKYLIRVSGGDDRVTFPETESKYKA